MALLEILHYPDPRLRKRAQPVDVVDESVARLADDMLETMYEANGIGLAAVQVNVHKRVLVADISENGDQPLVLVNPTIAGTDGHVESQEGCLSVPGYVDVVNRAERIGIHALDPRGDVIEMEAEGLLAICIQHEIDHLDGKLFVDYLSELKRQRLKKKIEKARREGKPLPAAPAI